MSEFKDYSVGPDESNVETVEQVSLNASSAIDLEALKNATQDEKAEMLLLAITREEDTVSQADNILTNSSSNITNITSSPLGGGNYNAKVEYTYIGGNKTGVMNIAYKAK